MTFGEKAGFVLLALEVLAMFIVWLLMRKRGTD